MKYFVYPYKAGSQSAKLLAQKLGGKCIKLHGSNYQGKASHLVINWGSSGCPIFHRTLNCDTRVAGDKLKAFKALKAGEVNVPPFTTKKDEAQNWVNDGSVVFARTVLNGHSGAGIVVVSDGSVPVAPLYTLYIKKKQEYRIHVVKDNVIHVQQKKKKEGFDANKVRSHANGYVFAVNDIDPPQTVIDEAKKAVQILGLDFGAVDVIYNDKQHKAYVLEVNTAPGLCDTTANIYAQAFKND